ncbi:hypothetical protein GNI_149200 [Gregarina niphandrodes]|uniref:Aspartyl protease n=1 Tax=Gregarina niphandrodes TaxID=110365 RepID=A0A023AZL6_GRENI|nr:hypothetical protein GNI_149200 [Gregarina niphandrodes]EZG44300.1 hypothetical protein GNI_149200 [Gregarina niphandrodes]|eukprot:XP_011132718.1 hypothetical protein GNI_149200 [Gregarina niphandrodes]
MITLNATNSEAIRGMKEKGAIRGMKEKETFLITNGSQLCLFDTQGTLPEIQTPLGPALIDTGSATNLVHSEYAPAKKEAYAKPTLIDAGGQPLDIAGIQ